MGQWGFLADNSYDLVFSYQPIAGLMESLAFLGAPASHFPVSFWPQASKWPSQQNVFCYNIFVSNACMGVCVYTVCQGSCHAMLLLSGKTRGLGMN